MLSRQREGIVTLAKQRGAYKGVLIRFRRREGIVTLANQIARSLYTGRKKALSPKQAAKLRQRASAGEQKIKLAWNFGSSRETLYQYLRRETDLLGASAATWRTPSSSSASQLTGFGG